MSMTTQGIKQAGATVDNTTKLPDDSVANASKKTVVVPGVKPPAANSDFGKGVVSNGPDDYQKDGTPKY